MLALTWYRSTPLPDTQPHSLPPPPDPTELSNRLLAAFDASLHCDIHLQAGPDAEPVAAHRVVLRRNPALGLDSAGAEPLVHVALPEGVSVGALRALVRLHYLEVLGAGGGDPTGAGRENLGIGAHLAAFRRQFLDGELALLQGVFGPLTAAGWSPLCDAIDTALFTDCALELSGGIAVRCHRVLVAGTEDGFYFTAALRWPGRSGARHSVTMPEGLSKEALIGLLRLRYGSADVDIERILEARHFAELFDWAAARERCTEQLEALLADAGSMDGESLVAILEHAEGSAAVPMRVKAAAIAAAVRQWGKVTEAAESALHKSRCAELRALNRVRNKDGHVCGSLEEYLHAAVDDLCEWERGIAWDAPKAVRLQLEQAWEHWHQILFEYGRIFGAATAERWRDKVRDQRLQLRLEREAAVAARLQLSGGRVWFEPTRDWREVPRNAVCPGGLEYRMDMESGRNFARLIM
mmetsp:Transcript_66528/g.187383  ORF Transcript_66528/g.187383 Transcript_66528/m.187383 type:complete len:467 (-) Transcript_66528:164-1564(-)|eukprot:CAMPEP_0179315348 /NCGR_PEP_ID=MMETSP0797-20121207/55003_1 /TAXON_ID=47934 /ORGANISM="Dinophysis acuminata, Strain DAEP01" /LENGTH=466 /DNA_ID=CAMNT_0021025845 /DNA_START=65 /DNA_END=1465 /DNA_ORIENTATION=-